MDEKCRCGNTLKCMSSKINKVSGYWNVRWIIQIKATWILFNFIHPHFNTVCEIRSYRCISANPPTCALSNKQKKKQIKKNKLNTIISFVN